MCDIDIDYEVDRANGTAYVWGLTVGSGKPSGDSQAFGVFYAEYQKNRPGRARDTISDVYALWRRGQVINDGQARVIASDWHGGQGSSMYSLTSCGAIDDRLHDEIEQAIREASIGQRRLSLLALDRYVRQAGERGPISGWSGLWDDTPVTVEQC